MLDTWVSDVVVGLFAMLFGGTFRLMMLLAPESATRATRVEGETWVQTARRQADAGAHLPRSAALAACAVYGLLAVIIVTIRISAVEMRWLAFAVGFAVGLAVFEIVFRLAKRSSAAPASGPWAAA